MRVVSPAARSGAPIGGCHSTRARSVSEVGAYRAHEGWRKAGWARSVPEVGANRAHSGSGSRETEAMGAVHPTITQGIAEWIGRQQMFIVATAPLDADGRVNVSPKGLDTLRVLDECTLAYLDLTGSGAETIAHVRENGRITLMWSAFAGPPRIVRVHGRGEVIALDDARAAGLFPDLPGARAVILVHAERISDSCGYSVPLYSFDGQRTRLLDWARSKGDDELVAYRRSKNSASIDGLPALP